MDRYRDLSWQPRCAIDGPYKRASYVGETIFLFGCLAVVIVGAMCL